MIVDVLIGLMVSMFTGVIGLLPAWAPPDSITNFGESVGSAVAGVNGVFPVVTLGICIAMMIGVRLFVLAWGLLIWVYKLVPFKFT